MTGTRLAALGPAAGPGIFAIGSLLGDVGKRSAERRTTQLRERYDRAVAACPEARGRSVK